MAPGRLRQYARGERLDSDATQIYDAPAGPKRRAAPRRSRIEEARRRKRMRRYYVVAIGAVAIAGVVAGASLFNPSPAGPEPPVVPPAGTGYAVIQTASGTIVFRIFEAETPITSAHFISLFEEQYYNGLPWHRVEGFVIQTGQGPSRSTIPLELHPDLHNDRAMVGVARTSDPNSGSSQFYILKQDSRYLDTSGGGYTVFGQVLRGMEVVDTVDLNEVISSATFVRSDTVP